MVVTAVRSGPGLLVSWPDTPDALHFHVFAARYPSPSFYELTQSCCPLLTFAPEKAVYGQGNPLVFAKPCCPVRAGATSLQVENLDFGVQYNFKVLAEASSNATLGESGWTRVAAAPGAPGVPVLRPLAEDAGALYDMSWETPNHDGGDLIRGYRIHATIHSLNRSELVLVANSSASVVVRPLSDAHVAAPPFHAHLPLLPSHRYSLRVQALNTAGAGALSPPLEHRAPIGSDAEFELPLARWRRGRVARGSVVRHRVFLPPGTLSARIVLQHVATRAQWPATLDERQRAGADGGGGLYLYAQADTPPEAPRMRPGRSHVEMLGDLSVEERVDYGQVRFGDSLLRTKGMVNASASDGELSLRVEAPESRWVHVLIHAARLAEEGCPYDVRVETESGVAGALGGVDGAPGRHDRLDGIGWRYRVDPDGPSQLDPWVLRRHLHPMSDPMSEGVRSDAISGSSRSAADR